MQNFSGLSGLGFGKTNNEGFLEPTDYRETMPIDVLVMGSSQVEGFEIRQSEKLTEKLSDLLPEKTIYDIGISSHTLLTCVCNLEAALKRYKPMEAVIMETDEVIYSVNELQTAIDGAIPKMTGNYGGIFEFLSRNQFLRLAYKQLKDYNALVGQNNEKMLTSVNEEIQSDRYLAVINKLFEKISGLCKQKDTDLIILYHPETQLNSDGTLFFDTDPDALRIFRDGCESHGITFVDMTDSFKRLYEEEHKLPYGFINSRVGRGHFNADGHRLVAEELCAAIRSLETEKGR